MATVTLNKMTNGQLSVTNGGTQSTFEPMIVRKQTGANTSVVCLYVDLSAIPSGAQITLVEALYAITEIINAGGSEGIVPLFNPLNSSGFDKWVGVNSAEPYATFGAPSFGPKVRNLGGDAVANMQFALDSQLGWFAIGWRYELGSGTRQCFIDDNAQIRVTYLPPTGSRVVGVDPLTLLHLHRGMP